MPYRLHDQKGASSSKIITISVIGILVAVPLYLFIHKQSTPPVSSPSPQSSEQSGTVSAPIQEPEETEKKDTPATKPTPPTETTDQSSDTVKTTFTGTVLAGSISPLLDFKKSDFDTARASGKLVVLYFYANWCPVCKQETATALYPAFEGQTGTDIVGFRVHINDDETTDADKALAKQYNVSYQHTKVFIKDGKVILTSPDNWTKDRYNTEFTTALTQ